MEEDDFNEDTMFSGLKYWFRLIAGGLCLPFLFPWLVYQLYNSHFRNKVHRDQSLQEKVVLITGASSGLGEALCHECFKAGCKVILASRRKEELERVKKDLIHSKTKWPVYEPYILPMDLNELKDIPTKAEEALSAFGKIDILINNGGISYRGEITKTSLDVDVKLMVVNYFGHIALTKAILPSMIKAGEGHIVSVSSVQGKIAIPFRSAYAASKHATQAFFDVLRSELEGTNIHVCVVSPSYIKTNLSLNALQSDGSTYGITDQTTAEGMDPGETADLILSAIMSRQDDVILAPMTPRLAVVLRTICPPLYFHLMKNRAWRIRKKIADEHHRD
ncbi:dehydrogenase/reductase SDR family protein 7-like isoform X1 [Tachypleus tridentatus]|uniref:dehydrogenase/reductase SDR family protein 7-like isoform X1 n=1 Tax=Tachypleus tridentatus TaxID=6853 RepID=UPI003FD372FC